MRDLDQDGRAIVTYGRSIIALMIAQSLGSRGIDVIGCDDVNLTVLSFSKFVSKNETYAAPEKDEAQFISDLIRIVKENRPSDDRPYILIPAFRDARIIAKHVDKFDGLVTVACPSFEAIEQVNKKDELVKTAQRLNVESPKAWLPRDQDALKNIEKEIQYPVFIKPPDDIGGRGISKIENHKELKNAYQDLQERYPGEQILIQSLAKGDDYCFCGLFDHGKLVASMVYKNLQKFPTQAGSGVVRETVESKKFDVIAEKLMKPLRWHGVAGIDFMWDGKESTTPMMIEVNPRFWAGLDHSIKSNVDFPWLLYQLFIYGEAQDNGTAKTGHKTSLPGLPVMAGIESLFAHAINFENLEAQWPDIKKHLSEHDLKEAATLLKESMGDSFNLADAFKIFQQMRKQAKEAEKISYTEDDPFVGLGALFVLGSLLKYGELPPELTRS